MAGVNSVIVFGPTGQTGLQCLNKGIREGLEVTAFVENPDFIPPDVSKRLFKITQGDVLEKDRVEIAIEGHDAVISALGTGRNYGKTNLLSQGIRNITEGMKKHNITKLVVISDVCLIPSSRWDLSRLMMRNVVEDHQKQLEILKEDDNRSLEWTVIMAPRIKNSDKINSYKIAVDKLPGVNSVTTAELGDFSIKVLTDPIKSERFWHKKVGISSRRRKPYPWTAIFIVLIAILIGLFIYSQGMPPVIAEFITVIMGNYEKTPAGNATDNIKIQTLDDAQDAV